MMERFGNFVLGLGFFIGGVALIVVAIFIMLIGNLDRISMARESTSWPSVPGVITASKITAHTSIGSGDIATRTSYDSKVSYRYKVQGHDYESGSVNFDIIGESYKQAKEVTARYPLSKDVTVFYDPANPAQAVLERGKVPSIVDAVLGPAIFTLGGLVFGGAGLFILKECSKRPKQV